MHKNRIEAFSDGVIAIILTIMVLELKVPHGATLTALQPLIATFFSYLLSFLYLAIYWNNHHHLFQISKNVNGAILWANIHLLFWLSLVPFVTAWSGENHFAPIPVAFYGFILLMSGFAYFLLVQSLLRHHGNDSLIAKAIGNDKKGKISLVCYLSAIPVALHFPIIAFSIYVLVAAIWMIPDRRIEKHLT